MKGIEKARMGMIAVAVVMLESFTRRLTGTRRLSSGMMALVVAGIVLLVAAGSASAEFACVADDGSGDAYFFGDTVMKSCTLNGSMSGTNSHGLRIGADDVTIDGADYMITGDNTLDTIGIYNYDPGFGTYGGGHNNVVIRNLEISGFTDGIRVEGTMNSQCTVCRQSVENNNIYNCVVHDNSEGFGINLWKCVCSSTVDSCTVYSNTGTLTGSCDDPGAGIRLWGKSNYNNVINNIAHHNNLAGIYSKKGGGDCYNTISGNTVYENGQTGPDAMFTGGIRFQCKSTADNTIADNIVTDNIGPGIFIGGNDCTVSGNTVTGSKDANTGENCRGDGLRIDRYGDGGGKNTIVTDNIFCDNVHLGINVQSADAGTTGNSNTCDTTSNYDDDGTTGCTYSCSQPEKPDLVITEKSETFDGSAFTVTYTVKNNGGGNAGASTTCISVDGTQVATDPVGALAAGATHEGTVVIDQFDCPCGTDVTVKVCADNDDVVDESDETNNCLENTFDCPPCAADPKLCANPEHNFGTVQPGQTETWQFDVTNCGGAGTVTWTVSGDQAWITVSPTSGTDAGTVTVTINTTGLSLGTHTGTVTVESNHGTETGTITVDVQSTQVDPKLCANPEHDFGVVQPGQTETWQFDVTNCGGAGTLEWTASDDQEWITVSPTSGTDAGTVTVMVDTAGLSLGTHTGTVTVESNHGTETGTISLKVKGSQPSPPPTSAEVPTFTPLGMLIMVGLLGIAGIGVIRRG